MTTRRRAAEPYTAYGHSTGRPIIRISRICRLVGGIGLVALTACDRPTPAEGITDDEFVTVMVGLRRAALTHANDPEAFQAARDELLARTTVSDSMLHGFVARHAQDPERLADVFAAIRDSLRASPDEAIQ